MFRKTKKLFCLIAAAAVGIFPKSLLAQTVDPFNENNLNQPSAQSWQISQFSGEDPADRTGAMRSTVPVYGYTDPDFDFPVELVYSYDGYRPSQGSGLYGYGWALSCGGAVTRLVRGVPDEVCQGYDDSPIYGYYHTREWKYADADIPETLSDNMVLSSNRHSAEAEVGFETVMENMNPYSDIPGWRTVDDRVIESFPDLFFFSAPGLSGTFMLDRDSESPCIVIDSNVPRGELQVAYIPGRHIIGTIYAPEVTIRDGRGYTYEFGGALSSIEYSRTFSSLGDGGVEYSATPVAFYLRRITAPNGRNMEIAYSEEHHRSVTAIDCYTPYRSGSYPGTRAFRTSTYDRVISAEWTPRIDQVLVDGQPLLRLSYDCSVQDEYAESCFRDPGTLTMVNYMNSVFPFSGASRLSQIEVTNAAGDLIDRLALSHFQSIAGRTPRMFLSRVTSLRNGSYAFAYNEDIGSFFDYRDREATDHWGFANVTFVADIRSHLLIPGTAPSSLYSQMTDTSKSPAFSRGSRCALVSVTYPTGGCTMITYEPHLVSMRRDRTPGILPCPVWCNSMEVGGVRVSRIDDIAEDGDTLSRRITYQRSITDDRSSGQLNSMPRYILGASFIYRKNSSHIVDDEAISMETYAYSGECDSHIVGEPAVSYGAIQIHLSDGSIREKVYVSDESAPDLYRAYSEDQLVDEEADFEICTKRYYSDKDFFDVQDSPREYISYMMPPVTDRSLVRGKVLSERLYDSEGMLRKSTDYHYAEHMSVVRDLLVNAVLWNYRMAQGISSPVLTSVLESTYEGDDSIDIRTEYSYNALGQTITQTVADNRTGISNEARISYCHEISNTGTAGHSQNDGAVHSTTLLRGNVEIERKLFGSMPNIRG